MTDTHLSDLTFSALDLAAPLMQGIEEAGFTRCTPIQAQTLPFALAGRDIAGQAQTGTGKTAAFLVALFQNLLANPPPATRGATAIRALIIAPTRELAVQIHHDAVPLARRAFRIAAPAPTPDARGGAQAARTAAQSLADALAQWLGEVAGSNPSLSICKEKK